MVKRCQWWIAECSAHVFGSGRCNATKEIDACDCGGDAARCDFYPEVREEAWRAVRNDLIRRSDALAQFPLPSDAKWMIGNVININSVRMRLERVPAAVAAQEWISVEERLPEEGEYVLIFADSIQVARILKGITEEERTRMRNGEIEDALVSCWDSSRGYHFVPRSSLYRSSDVQGNNKVPYSWKAHGGPMSWFGQDVSHWMPLPHPPQAYADNDTAAYADNPTV